MNTLFTRKEWPLLSVLMVVFSLFGAGGSLFAQTSATIRASATVLRPVQPRAGRFLALNSRVVGRMHERRVQGNRGAPVTTITDAARFRREGIVLTTGRFGRPLTAKEPSRNAAPADTVRIRLEFVGN